MQQPVSDPGLTDLLAQASFTFIGTVEGIGVAATDEVAASDRTATVRIDEVLHAPDALIHSSGTTLTVQLASDLSLLQPGDRAVFFTTPWKYGRGLAVAEVGRRSLEEVTGASTDVGGRKPAEAIALAAQELADQRIEGRAAQASAIIVGKVIAMEKIGSTYPVHEHDPDWWKATIEVESVEKGEVAGREVTVAYANSRDVAWRAAPKPRPGQEGVWLLHSTEPELREAAPYIIIDPRDLGPREQLDRLRPTLREEEP